MTRFRDREDAGAQLAAAIARRHIDRAIVLGIPRGGVAVSAAVARAIGADHGVVVARKLGAPDRPELAIGAITATGVSFVDRSLAVLCGADDRYLAAVKAAEADEARRREERFDSHRRPPVAGRTVIIVDDGVATGATAIAAVRSVKAEGAAHVILAVPVGPTHTIARLRQEADEVICLREEPNFVAVGEFYDDFRPIEDAEVKEILDACAAPRRSAPRGDA